MFKTVLLIIATALLFVNLILTILEAYNTYHALYPAAAHSGRIRGASEPISTGPEGSMSGERVKGRIKIGGMWYNTMWSG